MFVGLRGHLDSGLPALSVRVRIVHQLRERDVSLAELVVRSRIEMAWFVANDRQHGASGETETPAARRQADVLVHFIGIADRELRTQCDTFPRLPLDAERGRIAERDGERLFLSCGGRGEGKRQQSRGKSRGEAHTRDLVIWQAAAR